MNYKKQLPEINFLKHRLKLSKKILQKDKKFFRVGIIIFAICMTIFIVTLSYHLYLITQISSTNKKIKNVEALITDQKQVEADFLIFTNKLKIIENLFSERSDKQKAINHFSNLFGNDVFLEGISYSDDGTGLSLTINARSIFILDQVFATLSEEQEYPNIRKNNLVRLNNGTYSLDLIIDLVSHNNDQ